MSAKKMCHDFEAFLKISNLALIKSSTEKIRVSTNFYVFNIYKNTYFFTPNRPHGERA